MAKQTTTERIAEKIITELRQSGLSYGEMQNVVRVAKQRLDELKKVRR